MIDDPDYIVEIGDQRIESPLPDVPVEANISRAKAGNRIYISVLFECCSAYQRIYRNKADTAYEGCCPRCMRPVHIGIGPGGTDSRFFTAK